MEFITFLNRSRFHALLIAIVSATLQMTLMISMAKESWANLRTDGIFWVEGQPWLYCSMVLVTFLLMEAELRSSVEFLSYVFTSWRYSERFLQYDSGTKTFSRMYREEITSGTTHMVNLFKKGY